MRINDLYKICVGEDIELQKEYAYFVCIAEKDDYYILHDFEQYCYNNYLDYDNIDDVDEFFENKEELNINYYKNINSFESIYYKNQEVQHEKPKENKRKFVKV